MSTPKPSVQPRAARASLGALLARHRRKLRVVFWLYALALFTATHWPALQIHIPHIERPDLIAHFTCFGAWCALIWLSGYLGEPLRARTVLFAAVAACLYAGVDEGLQAIPWVRRTCAWDDYLANCIGIAIAAVVALAIVWFTRPRAAPAA